MWLRDPFPKLSKDETEDLQISTDHFNGNPWSQSNPINTGFYFVRSNNKTIALFDKWYSMKNNTAGQKEQDVLFNLIRAGIFRQLNLKVRFLNTLFFSGFCQKSSDFHQVSTVHANCCRTIVAKISDLRATLGDWKRFRKSTNASEIFWWTDHVGCKRSWKHWWRFPADVNRLFFRMMIYDVEITVLNVWICMFTLSVEGEVHCLF